MATENLKTMKEQLVSCVQSQMGDISKVDTHELGEAIDMIKSNVPNSINESYKEQDPNANVNTEYQEVAMVQDSVMARFTKKSNGKFVCEIYALEGSNGAIDNYADNFMLTK